VIAAPGVLFAGQASIGGAPLFGPLALDMVAGGWTCLLGPSGVGKSTVLRLIAGLDTGAAFHGRIEAGDGAPLTERVAYMAQDDLLLPWLDLRGNVGLGARLRGTAPDAVRRERLLDRLGLAEHAAKRPAQLSGGQRQRAALARTLMEDRPVVLLDEPFSALDARTRADMQELAAEALAGRSVLLVTHDPAEAARLGDRILLMSADGLTEVPPPPGPVIRPADDPDLLRFQASLLRQLRGRAAA
jgi:putative hydroxymethylpyrimidine transport system ATP-binding protein